MVDSRKGSTVYGVDDLGCRDKGRIRRGQFWLWQSLRCTKQQRDSLDRIDPHRHSEYVRGKQVRIFGSLSRRKKPLVYGSNSCGALCCCRGQIRDQATFQREVIEQHSDAQLTRN